MRYIHLLNLGLKRSLVVEVFLKSLTSTFSSVDYYSLQLQILLEVTRQEVQTY